MRIVLDTNVLVSGLLSPFGPPGEIVRLVTSGDVRVCYDARILGEYRQVLRRPRFPFRRSQVEALLDQIAADGDLTAPGPLPEPLPDTDDEAFLAVALAGLARCLVTGKLRDYPANLRRGVHVIAPRQFLDLYRAESLRGSTHPGPDE